MAVYMVTWNLNQERQNYATARTVFIAQVEAYEHVKDSGLETVRFISTTNTPTQISDYLRLKLDNNDRLFVTKLNKGAHAGWLAQDVWTWINARL